MIIDEKFRVSGIYMIRNKVNNKFYIGSSKNCYTRLTTHFSFLKNKNHNNSKLQNAVNKYGINNFELLLLEIVENNELVNREQFYLNTLLFADDFINNKSNKFTKLGYNINPIAHSALGVVRSEEDKRKMSERSRGKGNNMYGKKHTPETIVYQSKIKIGKKNPMYGKKHTEETLKKLSSKNVSIETRQKIGNTHRGKILSQETKQKIRNSKLGTKTSENTKIKLRQISKIKHLENPDHLKNMSIKNQKIIYQIDTNNNIIKEWSSIKACAQELNVHAQSISNVLRGKGKTVKGHRFIYKN